MSTLFGHMFMPPGRLWKDFELLRVKSDNQDGHPVKTWERTGNVLKGILAEASTNDRDRMKHLWDQDQHSLTHTLVLKGTADVKKGDRLDFEEKTFLVLTGDDVGMLGGASILYLEERNDLK